jgi:hypothetical protein
MEAQLRQIAMMLIQTGQLVDRDIAIMNRDHLEILVEVLQACLEDAEELLEAVSTDRGTMN